MTNAKTVLVKSQSGSCEGTFHSARHNDEHLCPWRSLHTEPFNESPNSNDEEIFEFEAPMSLQKSLVTTLFNNHDWCKAIFIFQGNYFVNAKFFGSIPFPLFKGKEMFATFQVTTRMKNRSGTIELSNLKVVYILQ
jgi:hypothetical protein